MGLTVQVALGVPRWDLTPSRANFVFTGRRPCFEEVKVLARLTVDELDSFIAQIRERGWGSHRSDDLKRAKVRVAGHIVGWSREIQTVKSSHERV